MHDSIKTLLVIAGVALASACGGGEEDTARADRDRDSTGGEARRDHDGDHHDGDHHDGDRDARVADTGDGASIDRDGNGLPDDGSDPPTAFDQGNSDGDIAITQAIRSAVSRDDSLSMTARNVTIITRDSVVTLRGNVNTDAERATVERHASEVDGVERIDNLIVVAP
jgi:hypothetical protein